VPEAVLRVDESLREERVVGVGGARVGNAVRIAPHVDGAEESAESSGAPEVGERAREINPSVGHRRLR